MSNAQCIHCLRAWTLIKKNSLLNLCISTQMISLLWEIIKVRHGYRKYLTFKFFILFVLHLRQYVSTPLYLKDALQHNWTFTGGVWVLQAVVRSFVLRNKYEPQNNISALKFRKNWEFVNEKHKKVKIPVCANISMNPLLHVCVCVQVCGEYALSCWDCVVTHVRQTTNDSS